MKFFPSNLFLVFLLSAGAAFGSGPGRSEILSMAVSGTLPESAMAEAYYEVLMAVSVPGRADIERSVLVRLQGDLEGRLGMDVVRAAQVRAGQAIRKLLDEDLSELRKAADSGVMAAQYDLADVYWQGIGIDPDPELAEKYARLAARQGYAAGQRLLAIVLLRKGWSDEALSWLEKAAAQNDPPAQFMLAMVFLEQEDDQGVGNAVQMVGQAAGVGYVPAQAFLAEAFLDGKILPRDLQAAAMWARMVLEKGAGDPVLEARMREILVASGEKTGR